MRKSAQSRVVGVVLAAGLVWLGCVTAGAQENNDTACNAMGGSCLVASESMPTTFAAGAATGSPHTSRSRLGIVAFRTNRGGPFAHHWVEVQTSRGDFTLGFGPALIPFIDRGQITVEDAHGHIEWRYLLHPFSLHMNFARGPGIGQQLGKAVYLPIAQADRLVEKQRHRRFIFPYIPFFHDCRTYVCAMRASTQGKSTLPCYLLLKGYW
jgi:hypothetical protein